MYEGTSSAESLQKLYDSLTDRIEDLAEELIVSHEYPRPMRRRATTWLKNLLSSLRIWAIDIRERRGALEHIRNTITGFHVSSCLLMIEDQLLNKTQVATSFLGDDVCYTHNQLPKPDNRAKCALQGSTRLQLVSRALIFLQECVEPIEEIVGAKTSAGKSTVPQSQIDKVYTAYMRQVM